MNESTQSNVQTEKVELEVGKESKDVVIAVTELIKDIKAGKDISTISAENLPLVMEAVKGYDMIDDEMKHKSRNATIAYAGYSMGEALAPVK